jgi:hypothetical protein
MRGVRFVISAERDLILQGPLPTKPPSYGSEGRCGPEVASIFRVSR